MATFGKRHPVLLRFQMKVLGIAFAAMLALTGVGWYQQQSDIQAQQAQAALVDVRADFYQDIANRTSAADSSVENRLAEKLGQLVGETNPQATSLPRELESFDIGNTNTYRGVSNVLGVDPFAEASTCTECGQLSEDFKAKLLQIKQGRVEQVISSEQITVDTGLQLTPFGMSGMSEGLLIWVLGGPLSLFAAHRWAYVTKNDYELRRFGDLDWKLDGTCDGTKLTIMGLSLSFFIPYLSWRKHQQSEFAKQVENKFPAETNLLNGIQRMLDRLALGSGDSSEHQEAEESVQYLRRELESRTRSGADARLDSHYQRILQDLSEVEGGLRLRDEGMDEINRSLGQSPPAKVVDIDSRRQQGTG